MSYDFGTTSLMPSPASTGSLDWSQQGQTKTRSSLIVAATGTGKTVIMGGLARSWPKGRVMMMSHRYELNQQSIASFSQICGEEVDLEQGQFVADRRCSPTRIVVASVQTLTQFKRKQNQYRYERFDPYDFGLLMIDEAHRSAAVTYRKVIDHFRQNPNLCLIGVTATPDRGDGVGMGCVYESTACDLNLLWGIENGWLVAPRQLFVQINGLDMSQIRTVGGDLDVKQLAKLVEQDKNLHAMAEPIVDVCGQTKQAIVFTASVAQAHRLSEIIRDYHNRIFGGECKAVALDGSMSPQDPKRMQIVRDFKEGSIQYLVNCGVATEGFDAPNVKVIAIARPTKMRSLYLQMLGRGTRPIAGVVDSVETATERLEAIKASDKPYCTVIDFIGQAGRHSLVCSTDFMLGENEPKEIRDRANKISSAKDFDGSTLEALKEAREQMAREEEARRARVTVKVDYKLVEQRTSYDLSTIPFSYRTRFNSGKLSDKQSSMLLRLGYTQSQIEKMTKIKASEAIDHAKKNPINDFGRWLQRQTPKEPANEVHRSF